MNLLPLLFFLLIQSSSSSSPCLGFHVVAVDGPPVGRRRRVTTITTAFQQQLQPQARRSASSFLATSSTTGLALAAEKTGSSKKKGSSSSSNSSLGFGGSPPPERQKKKKPATDKKVKKSSAAASAAAASITANKPYVKSQTDDLVAQLQAKTAKSCLGLAVAEAANSAANRRSSSSTKVDPFWEFIPALIASKFPNVKEAELQRVAGFVRHAVHKSMDDSVALQDVFSRDEEEIFWNPHRPQDEIHAYMPGLGETQPFHDAAANGDLKLCRLLSDNFETIRNEYHALLQDNNNNNNNNNKDRFQSVTSMNYKSGWKTMVLFYNGHRIPGFPYHLCPTTTRILETSGGAPLAGRIAGFNRQDANTGIPLHTDGNNMWLTCQMGIHIPEPNDTAYITVGPETRHWQEGKCLVYDTTYRHETMNGHASQERVVLHVDFFNTFAMTPVEIKILQYIYAMREEFMKAEGVSKVGAQIL